MSYASLKHFYNYSDRNEIVLSCPQPSNIDFKFIECTLSTAERLIAQKYIIDLLSFSFHVTNDMGSPNETPISVQVEQKGTQTGYELSVLYISHDVWTLLSKIDIW